MTTPYVGVDRVKEAMPSSYTGTDDNILTDIITSASAFIDNYCGVANGGFATQTYDELYHGTGDNLLFLVNHPVQTISRIATTTLPALSIHNTDPDMGCRATVQVVGTPSNSFNMNSQYASTGITLTYIKSAVTTTNTLTWASYPTVTQLVAAINALGNNWTALVQGGFGSWSTTDIRASQGAFGARVVTAYLWIHWYDIPWWRLNEQTGEVYSPMGFARGWGNWRVIYNAGYSTFPDDLTQALCELVVATYYARIVNANILTQSIGPGYSYTQAVKEGFEGLSVLAKKTLLWYKRHPVSKFGVF